jgi:hypothetical protein
MALEDLEQIKATLTALYQREAATRRGMPSGRGRAATPGGEQAELRSLLSAEPGLGKLGHLLGQRLDERGKAQLALQARIRDEARKVLPAGAKASAAAIEARRKALGLLTQPFTSSFVTLDKPLLIWELPHPNLDIFRDSGIDSSGGWAKILLQATTTPGGQHQTDFRFYFLWENPSDYYAVVNASSSMVLNGQAVAWGASGILSGDTASLYVTAYLSAIRWSGWGNDPVTGQGYDQTPYPIYDYQSANKPVVAFDAYGGDWFDDSEPGSADFDPSAPFDVDARLIAIPGHAVTMFQVGLTVSWWFHHGVDTTDGDGQSITLDLAYDPLGHIARCPMVQLEVLTPPA